MFEKEISKEFLEQALNRRLKSYRTKVGSTHGDNYMSLIHEVQLQEVEEDDVDETSHFILKTFPVHDLKRNFLKIANMFYKELATYEVLLPNLVKFCTEASGKNILLPFPKLISGYAVNYINLSEEEPDNDEKFKVEEYLLMEDAKNSKGYQMADREQGLSYSHVILVIKAVAKFHALSWSYKKNIGAKILSDKQEYQYLNVGYEIFLGQFQAMIQAAVPNALESMRLFLSEDSGAYKAAKDFLSDTVSVMEKVEKVFYGAGGVDEKMSQEWSKVRSGYEEDEPSWSVVCHGDLWINNLMFLNDKDNMPTDAILIDFQMIREGCPVTDLVYFFFSSVTAQLREQHMNDFLSAYYDTFIENCKMVHSEPLPGFSLESLLKRYKRSKKLGFFLSIALLPAVLKREGVGMEQNEVNEKENEDLTKMLGSEIDFNGQKNEKLGEALAQAALEAYTDGAI